MFQHLPEDKTLSYLTPYSSGVKELGLMESSAVRTDGGKKPIPYLPDFVWSEDGSLDRSFACEGISWLIGSDTES